VTATVWEKQYGMWVFLLADCLVLEPASVLASGRENRALPLPVWPLAVLLG